MAVLVNLWPLFDSRFYPRSNGIACPIPADFDSAALGSRNRLGFFCANPGTAYSSILEAQFRNFLDQRFQ